MAKKGAIDAGELLGTSKDTTEKFKPGFKDSKPNITSNGSENSEPPNKHLDDPSIGGAKETRYNHLESLKDKDKKQDNIEKGKDKDESLEH